jgi:hypothetical protein
MTKPTNKKRRSTGGQSKGRAARSTARSARRPTGLSPAATEVLGALFRLSRDTQRISARTLADEVELTATQAGEALVLLEQRGLVDATRARLTMLGLATAVQLGAGEGGGGGRVRKAAPEARELVLPQPAELPVAALPSQPPAPAQGFAAEEAFKTAGPAVALRLALY